MLTDEDVDSIVQNIGDAEDTKQDPIAKQLPINEFQKHAEESHVLFLDHVKDTTEENKNNAISSRQLNKMTTTASDEHNKTVELDKNEIMQDLHDSLTHVQLVQTIQEKTPIPEYKDDTIPKEPHEKSNNSGSKLYAREQEAIAKNADELNKEETKPVHEDKSFAENIEEFYECENTKITGDISPNLEEIPEKNNKDLETKLLVENDAKNENSFKNPFDPVPSKEIVQEISVAKVNQIEPPENEKLDHMKGDSVNNVEVGNCQEKASDVEENDKIKENSNVSQEDNSSIDKLDAVKVSETCNILEKEDNNEISSVQKNKPLHNNAQNKTGIVLEEISQRSIGYVSQTSNVDEKNSIATGVNSQNSTYTVEEHDNLFEHKLLVSIKQERELMASEDLNKENAEEPQTTIKTEKDDHAEESSLVVENTTLEHDKKVAVKIVNDSDPPTQSVEKQLVWEINPRDSESIKKKVLESEDNPAHESLIKEDEIMHDTSNHADKTLVWEIKSIISEPELNWIKEVPGNKERLPQHSLMKEASQDTLRDKPYSQSAAKQIDESASVAHVEVASEEQAECPPAKRATVEPVWTTNVIDEDQPNVSQQNNQESESDDVVLEKWFQAKGIAPGKETFARLLEKSRLNKGVLRVANLYKMIGKEELMFTILKKQIEHIDSEIVEKIAHIHLDRSKKRAQAYIKWKKEDMLLVVKAYHLLSNCNEPKVGFDDRSEIDWDENDKPIGATKNTPNGQVTTPCIYYEFDKMTTISGTRRPPTDPYITGHMNPFDPLNTYGLSKPFLAFFGLKAPLLCNVTASNLSNQRSMDSIIRIFSAAGTINSYFVGTRVILPESISLHIQYDHPLEAVQAMSMFHHQELDGRLISVTKGFYDRNRIKQWYSKRGLQIVGSGLGPNGTLLKNARHFIELSKLKNTTAHEIKQLKSQINDLKTKLASVDNMQNRIKSIAIKHKKNASKTEQAAATVLKTAIASSVQSSLRSILGFQPNQQSILPQNQNASIAYNSSASKNASTTEAGKIPTDTQKKAVSVAQNMPLPNMQTANPSVLNMQQNGQGFINAPDQYTNAYYAYMQGMQYCYPMATSTDLPGTLNVQPAISNVQPATPNIHSKPTSQTSNRSTDLPLSTASTSVYGIQKPATRFDIPPANIQSQKAVTATNLSIASNNIKKPATRFDVAPTNVLPHKVESATKSLETPLPTQTQALVKTAFKNVNPIQPIAAQAKPASIKINIPSLHPAQSPKKRTLDKNKMTNALPDLPTKLPAHELQKEEAWISEKIKEMWGYSKSPNEIVRTPGKMRTTSDRKGLYTDAIGPPAKRIRKSPESIRRSPEINIKLKRRSPKKFRKSPERCRKSTERLRKPPIRSNKSPERFRKSPERSRKSPEKSRKSPGRCRKSPERSRKSASNDSWDIEPSRSLSRSRKSPLRAAYEKPKDRSRERDSSDSKDRGRSKASFSKEREPERDNIMTKVYFTCLPASVTTEDLHEKMSEIGKVLFAHAYGDSGQGVVEFRHRSDAETCIEMYNLAKVDGKTIEARWYK